MYFIAKVYCPEKFLLYCKKTSWGKYLHKETNSKMCYIKPFMTKWIKGAIKIWFQKIALLKDNIPNK